MMFEIYLLGGVLALLSIGNIAFRWIRKKFWQLAFNIVALLTLLFLSVAVSESPGVYFNVISINGFSTFFFALFTASMVLVNLIAYARSRGYGNFALLASFALAGMYLVVSSTSLITIFLGLEFMSVPSAFMVLLSRRESLEAATKLFIMASIAIAFLSFAIVLVYGSANSLALEAQQSSSLIILAVVLFVASLGFEASVFPFNILIPDVYQGAAGYATAMLGGINKKVGLAALMQVIILLFVAFPSALLIITILSVFTMFYGNLVALAQSNFKRMLAYSSISQAGYILIGLAVATQEGLSGSIFQMFAHAFLFIGVLGIVAWLESKDRNEINDLIGLYRQNRLAAIALTIFMLSFVGVPFTTGFIGKFLIFLSAVNNNLAWLAIVGIVNSVISIFYYAKAMTAIYTNKVGAYHMRLDSSTLAVVVICLVVTLIFGIFPQPIMQMANGAASFLVAGAV